ncbi:MAG: [FeFe] hydrogenase H-cluster radical SAM maturase HydG [Nitrospirae bacterium]|nr:[FeFe] hydrogenase H-cluster radical SAM maturase HydG [Nitrospirota bacterium]
MRDTVGLSDAIRNVEDVLARTHAPGREELEGILARAEALAGLQLDDSAALLAVDDPAQIELICSAAGRVKDAVFGPRVVLFAPLYLSNYCSNDCLYCGFRRSNTGGARKALTPEEAVEQARYLSSKGFKRLLLVAGENHGRHGVDYLVDVAGAIYAGTDIRILHVNCAPLTVDGFRRLKAAGYGVYQCFQETYQPDTYARMHPAGRKKDYMFRLSAMDRALEAGFGDVGIGALLGLYDYRYDVLATIAHSRHLAEVYGAAAHTISVPRLRHAEGAALADAPYPVTDQEFRKIVAVYRLSVPTAGVVVSTREPAELREDCLDIGASQISAGSSTEPGGYGAEEHAATQFDVSDLRELSEMIGVIARKGLLPSLCTSCYRSGRQGSDFHDAASSGAMRDLCTPNALLSLKEYAQDSAEGEVKGLCEEAVAKFAEGVEEPLRRDLMTKLARVQAGERDVHY